MYLFYSGNIEGKSKKNTSSKSSSDETPKIINNAEIKIKQERISQEIASTLAADENRTKKTKTRKGKKEAKSSSVEESEDIKPIIDHHDHDEGNTTNNSVAVVKATLSQITVVEKGGSVTNTTAESIYEDALNDMTRNKVKITECSVVLSNIRPTETITLKSKSQCDSPKQIDSTYTMDHNETSETNATFVQQNNKTYVQPGNETYVARDNATFVQPGDSTFNIEQNKKKNRSNSLLTEDESYVSAEVSLEEASVHPKVLPKPQPFSSSKLPIVSKNKNEIFK